MELFIFFGIVIALVVLSILLRRPMVSDGKGRLIPESKYKRDYSGWSTYSPEGGANGSKANVDWKTKSAPDVQKVKDLIYEYERTGEKPSPQEWDSISKSAKNIAGWSLHFDKEHPHPENDFFYDGN